MKQNLLLYMIVQEMWCLKSTGILMQKKSLEISTMYNFEVDVCFYCCGHHFVESQLLPLTV